MLPVAVVVVVAVIQEENTNKIDAKQKKRDASTRIRLLLLANVPACTTTTVDAFDSLKS